MAISQGPDYGGADGLHPRIEGPQNARKDGAAAVTLDIYGQERNDHREADHVHEDRHQHECEVPRMNGGQDCSPALHVTHAYNVLNRCATPATIRGGR